jgi:hypothetical protein
LCDWIAEVRKSKQPCGLKVRLEISLRIRFLLWTRVSSGAPPGGGGALGSLGRSIGVQMMSADCKLLCPGLQRSAPADPGGCQSSQKRLLADLDTTQAIANQASNLNSESIYWPCLTTVRPTGSQAIGESPPAEAVT